MKVKIQIKWMDEKTGMQSTCVIFYGTDQKLGIDLLLKIVETVCSEHNIPRDRVSDVSCGFMP